MKKAIIAVTLAALALTGCGSSPVSEEEVEHVRYVQYGRYYSDGSIVTNDGNIWGYSADTTESGEETYNGMPVVVVFDDNGTPVIYDDPIIGIVFDRETAIYDRLEESLSESFELSRNGNNIKVEGYKE